MTRSSNALRLLRTYVPVYTLRQRTRVHPIIYDGMRGRPNELS